MGRLSKAAKKRREAEVRKAVEAALATNANHDRITRLETTLATIQQLVYSVLKPQPTKPIPSSVTWVDPNKPFTATQVLSDRQQYIADAVVSDEPISANPAELDDGDDLGPGRWI